MAGCCGKGGSEVQDEEKALSKRHEHTIRQTGVEVTLTSGQAELYSVPEDFHVASFTPEEVAKIIKRHKEEKKKRKPCGRILHRIKDLFTASGVEYRIIKFPIIFLVFYYILQIDYQYDDVLNLLCPDQWGAGAPASQGSSAALQSHARHRHCAKDTKERFTEWNKKAGSLTSLLTFLLGFYVADIVRRWWVKVVGIPNIKAPQLIMGGLVRGTPGPEGSLTSPEAVTEAQRMVARYCLLAWTMCLSTISQPLAAEVGTPAQLVKKGLLTEQERKALKADSSDLQLQKLVTDQWWVPLSWAVTLAGRIGPTGPTDQQILYKDHKDMVVALVRFESALDDQKERCENKLPAFYRRVIHLAVYAWVAISVFTLQDPSHYSDRCTAEELTAGSTTCGASRWLTLACNFPCTGMLVQLVILGWLAMADILQNPFGYNPDYDISLTDELEVSIWRASVTLQQLGNRGAGGGAAQLQAKLWGIIAPGSRGA